MSRAKILLFCILVSLLQTASAQDQSLYNYQDLSHLYYQKQKDSLKKAWVCPTLFKDKDGQRQYKEIYDSRTDFLLCCHHQRRLCPRSGSISLYRRHRPPDRRRQPRPDPRRPLAAARQKPLRQRLRARRQRPRRQSRPDHVLRKPRRAGPRHRPRDVPQHSPSSGKRDARSRGLAELRRIQTIPQRRSELPLRPPHPAPKGPRKPSLSAAAATNASTNPKPTRWPSSCS